MSNVFNDEISERAYEVGYDKGYEDCRSELEMKIKALLKTYLYADGYQSPSDLATAIGRELESKSVQIGK